LDSSITYHPIFDSIELGIGTWAWGDRLIWGYGNGYKDTDLKSVFDYCLEAGIQFFDTAEVYGQGQSEKFLGSFLKDTEKPVRIATKFMPYPWRLGKRSLLRAINGSLKRLGQTQVDLYQMHFPMPPLTIETWMEGMAEACLAGLTRAVGVSNFDRSQMQQAYETLTKLGVPLASNQVEFNLLNRKAEKSGLLQQCQELGIKVIAYSPLGMGALSGKYTPDNPPKGMRASRFGRKTLQNMQPLLSLINRIGADHAGKTPSQVALNWIICKGAIPIPGAKSLLQVEQNLGALGWRLTEEEISRLDETSDRVSEKN
jgi:aryl-alcohol dehydrogenase-like predicted oxidoreductase